MSKEMKSVTNNELKCEIVQDLLPLYHDDVINIVTKQAVEQHLDECEACTREYHELCEEFPQEEKVNGNITKSKFDAMKKRLKKKQAMKTIFVVLILSIVLGNVLLNAQILPVGDHEFDVLATYMIEEENRTLLFMLYKAPHYARPKRYGMEAKQYETDVAIHSNAKRTIIISDPVYFTKTLAYEVLEVNQDTETVNFNGNTIWSKEENEEDEIPEYVSMIVDFENGVTEDMVITSEDSITIYNEDTGEYIEWDVASNIIREVYNRNPMYEYFEGAVLELEEEYVLVKPASQYWLADISDVIYVSLHTESGRSADDFKDIDIGDTVGVSFDEEIMEDGICRIDSVFDILVDIGSEEEN